MRPIDEGLKLEFNVARYDFSAAGEAAGRIKRCLVQLGISPEVTRRVAVAAYEAEMNLVIHSTGGVLSAHVNSDRIVLISKDTGPGIPDISLAMKEGFSTAPDEVREMGFGAGMGLPNMKRCSDELCIESEVGIGTTVTMVVFIPRNGSSDCER